MHKDKTNRSKRTNRADKTLKAQPSNSLPQITEDKIIHKTEDKMIRQSTLSDKNTIGPPTPTDFVNFLPWLCQKWAVPHFVTVIRASQEGDITQGIQKVLSEHVKYIKQEVEKSIDYKNRVLGTLDLQNTLDKKMSSLKIVIIEAHYNEQNQLEQLSFVECRGGGGIPIKVIRAINLCLPFHPNLTRLNICKGGLTPLTLCEITKMLPHSNITIIWLDNTVLPVQFHKLIQVASSLTYLSLRRCKINDKICKQISINLSFGEPAASCLKVLELALNDITDLGAHFLGEMLRTNRHLVHLNLACNKITNDGGKALITPLMEFELTCNEVLEMKRKRYKKLEKKISDYKNNIGSGLTVFYEDTDTSDVSFYTSVPSTSSQLKSSRCRTVNVSPKLDDKFTDPFSFTNLLLKNGSYVSRGNLTLCSLNLAYNSLNYQFLKKLEAVLLYQHRILEFSPVPGLIRITLDGNYMPETCPELDRIASFLNSNIDKKQTRVIEKKRLTSNTSKISTTQKNKNKKKSS